MKLFLSVIFSLLLSNLCFAEQKKERTPALKFNKDSPTSYDDLSLFQKLTVHRDHNLDLERHLMMAHKGKMMGKGKGMMSSMMSKGKGKGMSSMMSKGKGKGKSSSKGKGKGMSSMMSKGKGKGKGKSSMMSKGKGKSSMMSKGKGKGKGKSSMMSKGKGKGKGKSSSKGKGKGKGSSSKSKGKGKGKGSSSKGKGKGKGMPAKGKGKSSSTSIPTLEDIVVEVESLSTLEYALKAAGLLYVFGEVPLGVSVLAPDNAAFAKLEEADPELYKVLFTDEWILHLQNTLLNHVIEEIKAADVEDGALYDTAAPGPITSAVGAVVGDKTCFIPALAEEGGCVVMADVMAKNGIAHIIDSVLLPYWAFYTVTDLAVEFQEDAQLKTLVELVTCAGLGDALSETFGITVFAPNDDAFMGIDKEYYCGDGVDELTDILTYHVVPKVVPSVQIYSGKKYLPTLYGKPVSVQKKADNVMVNGANVLVADLLAYNGIVHIIDSVLEPPKDAAPPPSKGGTGNGTTKGKGKGKGSSSKGKGKGMSKGKGKGSSSKGKGKGMSKGKGKGMSSKGKGKGMSKGKGMGKSKGKGKSSKGKGKSSKGKSKSSKGKGKGMSKGKGMMGKGKMGKGMMSKGKGMMSKGK